MLLRDLRLQRGLAPVPALAQPVRQRSPGEAGRPVEPAHEIEDGGPKRRVAVAVDQPGLGRGRAERLPRGIEPGADQRARGAEHKRRGEAPAVRDPARGGDRPRGDRVDHRRYERQGRALGAMAAGLRALRDYDLGAERGRGVRVGERLHLQNQLRPRLADRRHERRGVAEREHDRSGLARQRHLQPIGILGEMPGDEADANRRTLGRRELPLDPRRVVVASADQAEAAGLAHGRRERAPRDAAHRRQQDRMTDAEKIGQRRPKRHRPAPP